MQVDGIEWSDKRCKSSLVTAAPPVNFIKSPYDDDFTAVAWANDTEARRRKSRRPKQ